MKTASIYLTALLALTLSQYHASLFKRQNSHHLHQKLETGRKTSKNKKPAAKYRRIVNAIRAIRRANSKKQKLISYHNHRSSLKPAGIFHRHKGIRRLKSAARIRKNRNQQLKRKMALRPDTLARKQALSSSSGTPAEFMRFPSPRKTQQPTQSGEFIRC